MFDVAVIGGGVIGGAIVRELTKYRLSACLLEKESDICMGASKANSGIVHAGFDAQTGSNKAKFNVAGNQMMESFCADLGVKFRRNGSLVVAFTGEEKQTLLELYNRGLANGVPDMEIIDRERLVALEPNISGNAVGALWAKTGGIVCPYELTIACIGNAMDNGASLFTDFEVVGISKTEKVFILSSADGQTVNAKLVINCAGFSGGKIASLVGDSYEVKGRKGEYILLDRESGDFVSHTLFFTPTKLGKGILITQTVDNNILLGPTAEEGEVDTQTSAKGLGFVTETAKKMCNGVPFYNTITSFCGVRAYTDKHDFIIKESKNAQGVFHLIGIESPGLTASPAIAKFVVEEMIASRLALVENKNFNGKREPDYFFKNLTLDKKNELIKKDPRYGKIVCRCEQITEGEIVRAIKENPPARDIDAIKRRTRSGMGRCQGGFCQPFVAEILARELGKDMTEITKNGKGSYLITGVTK